MSTGPGSKKADLFEGDNLWMPFPWEWEQMRRNRAAREAAKAAKAAKAIIVVADSDDEGGPSECAKTTVGFIPLADLWSADLQLTPRVSRKRPGSVVGSAPRKPKQQRYRVHPCNVWLPKLGGPK